jgi:hypothetical protein
MSLAIAGVAFLETQGTEAGDLAETFLGTEENDTQTVHLGDVLWEDRQSWAGLETQLGDAATLALQDALRSHADSCVTVAFNPAWLSYEAAPSRWRWSLGLYNVKVRGDVWVGRADASGTRPVQLRYKVFLSDVYDFGPSKWNGAVNGFYQLWEHGRADAFRVEGHGVNTRTFSYDSRTTDFYGIGLNW